MNGIKEKILTKIKDVKIREVVYPTIVVVFLLTMTTLFIISANSLSKTINKSLTDGESLNTPMLINKENLNIIIKKLNIGTGTPRQITASEKLSTTTKETTTDEKSMFKISILNIAGKAELVGNLKKSFAANGYKVLQTGNSTEKLRQTTLKIKKSGEKFKDDIISVVTAEKDIVGKIEELPEDSVSDAIIILGKNE